MKNTNKVSAGKAEDKR